MVDLLLHQRRSASDAVTATGVVRSMLGTGDVTVGAGDFTYTQWALVDDGISVGRIVSSGTDVRLRILRAPDLVGVVVSEGRLQLRRGSDAVVLGAGDVGLVPLDEEAELAWEEVRFELYSLPVSAVLRMLPNGTDSVRLHAPRITPRSAELGRFWRLLAGLVAGQVLSESGLYERDLLRAQMIDALTAATIEAFDLTDETADDESRDGALVERAQEYLLAHLGDPISIGDVARAVGLSSRGLQVVYQRRGDETPLGHLRRLRLEAARRELLHGLGGTTVTAVARRLGYTNIGRFGAHYRDLYGESPSATLQRRTARV